MNNKNLSFTYGIEDAITPIDGRNRHKLKSLSPYFSEFALDKYRIKIELEYLKKLSQYKVVRKFSKAELASINRLNDAFCKDDYKRIREIEKVVNHDVKAIEEFIKEKLKPSFAIHFAEATRVKKATEGLENIIEMVHFGITSDDTNNLAYGSLIRDSLSTVIIPEIEKSVNILKDYARKYKNIAMLSRTHGQPAVPTTMGKEIAVYVKRLEQELSIIKHTKIRGKLTGNVGNLNVHKFLYPNIDWLKFSQEFVQSLGLEADLFTTQIQPYDSIVRLFDSLKRINNIMLSLCQDMWWYICLGYFKQKVIREEVGSTALPHKINPIYFEGAEGGFGIANAMFKFYDQKLSYSRLQRDLSDSTVRRSFGIAFAYSLLSYQSIVEALNRIEPNQETIKKDLNNHWEILSEAIQNFLRVKGQMNAYDQTKLFFRGRDVNQNDIRKFINGLKLNNKDKEKLLSLTPEKYTGYASEIVDKV